MTDEEAQEKVMEWIHGLDDYNLSTLIALLQSERTRRILKAVAKAARNLTNEAKRQPRV